MIKINNLSLNILNDISFNANDTDIIGVVGYSGAGKTTLLKAIANVDKTATGKVKYNGNLGFIYQNAKSSIAPTYKLITQCCDGIGKQTMAEKIFAKLGLTKQMNSFVDLISGGQQMRSLLAMNLHRKPKVLLLDEPTANLDGKNTKIVVKEIFEYAKKNKCTLIWVSHDMALMKKIATKVLHLDNGKVVEYTSAKQFFKNPKSVKGKNLLKSVNTKPNKTKSKTAVLKFDNVSLGYGDNQIVKGLSFTINKGECIGLFGESGIGKSTVLRGITKQLNPTTGNIKTPNKIQMIFQDAKGSLNPKLSILEIVGEPLGDKFNKNKVINILKDVGIEKFRINDKPNSFSGGECQRIAIARAFINNPDLILADEMTSALDSHNKNIILKLITKLQSKNNTAIIFASHDKDALSAISSRVIKL
ncbi:MAG: ABC transporter ATP-binding protein [Alphaproteobacteria bacterium]